MSVMQVLQRMVVEVVDSAAAIRPPVARRNIPTPARCYLRVRISTTMSLEWRFGRVDVLWHEGVCDGLTVVFVNGVQITTT